MNFGNKRLALKFSWSLTVVNVAMASVLYCVCSQCTGLYRVVYGLINVCLTVCVARDTENWYQSVAVSCRVKICEHNCTELVYREKCCSLYELDCAGNVLAT